MRILHDNILKRQTVTASSESGTYPIGNAFARAVRKIFRTDDTTSVTILITGNDSPVNHLYMQGLNLTDDAVVTIEGNDTNEWSAPVFDEAVDLHDGFIFHEFETATNNYWRISIEDTTNPDGFLEIAQIWLSGSLEMPGMEPTQEVPLTTTTDYSRTESGEVHTLEGYDYRQAVVSFPYISNEQRNDIRAFWTNNKYSPVIIAIWPGDLEVEPPFYAIIPEAPKWMRSDDQQYPWSLKFEFQECF